MSAPTPAGRPAGKHAFVSFRSRCQQHANPLEDIVSAGNMARRRAVVTADKLKRAKLLMTPGHRVFEEAQRVGVGKTALYEALAQDGATGAE